MALKSFQARGGLLNPTVECEPDIWKPIKFWAPKLFISALFLGALSGFYQNIANESQRISEQNSREAYCHSGLKHCGSNPSLVVSTIR